MSLHPHPPAESRAPLYDASECDTHEVYAARSPRVLEEEHVSHFRWESGHPECSDNKVASRAFQDHVWDNNGSCLPHATDHLAFLNIFLPTMGFNASKCYAGTKQPPHNLDKYNLQPDEERSLREVLETSIRRVDADRQRERHRRQSRKIQRRIGGLLIHLESPYFRYSLVVMIVIGASVFPFFWWLLYQWSKICDYKAIAIASHTISYFSEKPDYCLSVRNLETELFRHSQSPENARQLIPYTSPSNYMLDKHSLTTRASEALARRLQQLSPELIGANDIVRSSGTVYALCRQSLRCVSLAYPQLQAYLSGYSAQTGDLYSTMSAASHGHGLVAWAESRDLIPRWFRPYTQLGRAETNVVQFYKAFISDTKAREVNAQSIVNITQQSLTELNNLDALLLASGRNFSQICIPYLDHIDQQVSIVHQLIQIVKRLIPGLGVPLVAIATEPPMEQCVAHGGGEEEDAPGKAYADLIVELRFNLSTIQADARGYEEFHSKTANRLISVSARNDDDVPRFLVPEDYRVTNESTRRMQELHDSLVEMYEEYKQSRKVNDDAG
ncbi:hypothetical protein AC578_4117 [Pseudocercospora eumusae]|uniref:Uncharacterized protein n=1 Tax=Pseudocercospora eumusae TaxID=321146 RepID=A0A139HF11_9PEZI|nr:hypothetical protein AC578_4117 [Pseudocercospora eumusae]